MRAIVLCLLEHQGRLLLQEFWHEHHRCHFYRPPGGGIERGERSLDAVRREMREELDTEIRQPRLLRVLENIFEYGGEIKHEIVFLYQAGLADERLTASPVVELVDNTIPFRAVWQPLSGIVRNEILLYPEELRLELPQIFPG